MFLRVIKFNISLVFISQSHFKMPKTIRLNTTHYFIMKIPNRRQVRQIASNYFSDIDFKDLMKLYKDYTKFIFFMFTSIKLIKDCCLK